MEKTAEREEVSVKMIFIKSMSVEDFSHFRAQENSAKCWISFAMVSL